MLHKIKTKVARFVGKQIGECKVAFDEGYQLGLTITTSKQVNNDVESTNNAEHVNAEQTKSWPFNI